MLTNALVSHILKLLNGLPCSTPFSSLGRSEDMHLVRFDIFNMENFVLKSGGKNGFAKL
jgi:hypothetical protein